MRIYSFKLSGDLLSVDFMICLLFIILYISLQNFKTSLFLSDNITSVFQECLLCLLHWYKYICIKFQFLCQDQILFIYGGKRWSSGSALDSVVRILPWPKVNFSGHKKWISEAPLDQAVNCTLKVLRLCKIPWRCMLAVHKTGSDPYASFLTFLTSRPTQSQFICKLQELFLVKYDLQQNSLANKVFDFYQTKMYKKCLCNFHFFILVWLFSRDRILPEFLSQI